MQYLRIFPWRAVTYPGPQMGKLSALASQLRSIQQADHAIGGVSTVNNKYVASFVYDEREATDIDNSVVLNLAKSGIEELKALEPAFARFELSLFGESTLDLHRSTMSQEENETINNSIKTFLRLLSPYFLQKPAHACLEWLIRKFRITELNLDALMDCILPYHETVPFIRMLQIIYFPDNSKWSFLHEVKKDAKVISRSFLARRALADRSLIDSIFDCLEWMLLKHRDADYRKPSTYLSFFTMFLMDYIHALPRVELTHVLHLYPIALRLVKVKRVPDASFSSYMIMLALAQRYPLMSAEAVADYIDFACRSCQESMVPQLLLTVARLIESCHLTVTSIPTRVFGSLSRLDGFAEGTQEIIASYQLPHFKDVLAASFAKQDEILSQEIRGN